MTYASRSNQINPAAFIGAISLPLGVGAILVAGLAVSVAITQPDPNPTGVLVSPKPIDPLPPPPEPPTPKEPEVTQRAPQRQIIMPQPPSPFDFETAGTPEANPFPDDLNFPIDTVPIPTPNPSPVRGDGAPSGPAIMASPRGNPGKWVNDTDYRSRWIREGLSGVARFTVEIDTTGRVTDCRITSSTGHAALDTATCRLVTRRARFAPARDAAGAPVTGTYSNAVNWQIPD